MGFWSVLGWFLFDAAYSVVKHVRGRIQNIVSEAMSAPFSIEPDLLISHLIDSILPLHRQVAFPVAQNHRLHGMLALEDLKSVATRTLASHARSRRHASHRATVFRRTKRNPRLRTGADEAKRDRFGGGGRKNR